MEFIPLKKHKGGKAKTVEEENKFKKLVKDDEIEEKQQKKFRKKCETKIIGKNFLNNKSKQTVSNHKFLKQAVKKETKEEEENLEKKEEEQEESEENEDADEDEEAFKKKCKKMDEKKKNRLFIKLKKKILNEMQIKELHPDIRGVIFPRKKKSRWCWAVFASEEKAKKALKDLNKNKGVLANKPTSYERVDTKTKEKMKTILRKKQARKKLQEMWT